MPAVFSFIFALAGQTLIYFFKNIPFGLIFFVLSAAALVIAGRGNTGNTGGKNDFFSSTFTLSKKAEVIILLLIFSIAIFMRLFRLGAIPAGGYCDEAANGLIALDILHGKALPVFNAGEYSTSNAAALIYLIAAVFKFAGAGMTQIRLTSALFGILAIPAIYFLIRSLAGAVPALTAAFLLAIMRWHITFSRIGFQAALGVFAVILVIYFAFRAYYSGKTGDFIILGFLSAFSIYAYRTAMLVPLVLMVFLIFLFFYDPAYFRSHIRGFAACAATALIALGPLIYYAANNKALFMNRQEQVSIFNRSVKYSPEKGTWEPETRPRLKLLLDNIKETLLMFNYRGDSNSRHNLPYEPELDFFTGMFAAVGFIFALTRLFNPVYFFFTSAFIILMSSGFFTIEAPQGLRTLNAMPCVIFFAVVFIGRFTSSFKDKKFRITAWIIIAASLLVSMMNNYNIYFNRQAVDPRCWEGFSTKEYYAGRIACAAISSGNHVVSVEEYLEHPTFIFESGTVSGCEKFDITAFLKLQGKKNDMTYVLPVAYMPLAEYLKEIYPHTVITVLSNKYEAKPLLIYFTISAADINSPAVNCAGSGAAAEFFEGHAFSGKSAREKEPAIMMTRFEDPGFKISSAIWTAQLYIIKAGTYLFDISSFGASRLIVDRKTLFGVIAQDDSLGASKNSSPVYLSKGSHLIRVEYDSNIHTSSSDGRGNAGLWLFWKQPGSGDLTLVPGCMLTPY